MNKFVKFCKVESSTVRLFTSVPQVEVQPNMALSGRELYDRVLAGNTLPPINAEDFNEKAVDQAELNPFDELLSPETSQFEIMDRGKSHDRKTKKMIDEGVQALELQKRSTKLEQENLVAET